MSAESPQPFNFSPPLSEIGSPLLPSSSLGRDFTQITDMSYDDWRETVRNLPSYIPDDALQEDILREICEEIKEFTESVNDDGQACASSIFSMIMAKLTREVKKLITVDMMKLSLEFEPKSSN